MFGCHLWFLWRQVNWPRLPFRRGKEESQERTEEKEERRFLNEESSAMNIWRENGIREREKLNAVDDLSNLVNIINSSIPTTPEDPSPSCSLNWPLTASVYTITTTATTTTATVVTVRHCVDSGSIVSIDNVKVDSPQPSSNRDIAASPELASIGDQFRPWIKRENVDETRLVKGVDIGEDMTDEEPTNFVIGGMDISEETSRFKTAPIAIDEETHIASPSCSHNGSVTSEDDILQASVNTVIAAGPAGSADSGLYSASDAAVILPADHRPIVVNPKTPLTPESSNELRQHRHAHFALVAQMSDTESITSSESVQDFGGASVTSDTSLHRQTSGGSVGSGSGSGQTTYSRVQTTPAVNTMVTSHGRHSNYGLPQHPLLHQQVATTSAAAAAAAMRALSHTTLASLDDDLANAGRAAAGVPYDFAHSHLHGSAKHLHTEQVVSKHMLKAKLNKFQRLLDKAFVLINMSTEESIIEGCGVVAKVMVNAWVAPKIGHDLAYGLCDYLREMTYFDLLLHFLLNPETKQRVRLAAGRALEECLSAPNRDYIASTSGSDCGAFHRLERFVQVIKSFKEGEELRVAVSLLESLFKQSSQTNSRLMELSALDYVLNACKATTNSHTLRHAALALANLSMYSDSECQQRMIGKNVPDWLFLLASSQDDVTRYYACLAICVLVSNKEIEAAVTKSGTLSLVEPFLLARKPADFATSDYKHCQGRPMQWLAKLVPVLNAKRRESRSMAAFHFAMEAGIKKDQEALGVFEQIGAVEALKQVAALPEEVAPKFASMALEIIGEEVPYKLSHQVPLWSVEDVEYWVTHIGFEKYSHSFYEQKVDGDLLLLISDNELANDIGMKSGLLRKRFMRELESLKVAADYSCVDETQLDRFLVSINPHFSVYTYRLLEMGVDRSILPSLNDEMMRSECGVANPVHRAQLLQSVQECKHIDDMEVALLSKHIDIFISYRRSTGNQLASLIKVLLQLRGYKVFIDVDRLYAGKFDSSLLKNIQAAKHFVLVLTPHALDRCVDDDDCSDWVHKEVLCALEHNKNIIPVFDPQFEWPEGHLLPGDIRGVTRFNGVRWVHEYQEACVDKLEKFIEGEVNIDRGYNASPQRSHQSQHTVGYRTASKTNSSNGCSGNQHLTNAPDAADLVLEALAVASKGQASSQDQ